MLTPALEGETRECCPQTLILLPQRTHPYHSPPQKKFVQLYSDKPLAPVGFPIDVTIDDVTNKKDCNAIFQCMEDIKKMAGQEGGREEGE